MTSRPAAPPPVEIAAVIQKAMAFHKQGKLAEAERLYRSVLSVHQDNFEALHGVGLLRAQQHNSEEALKFFSRALEREPGSAEAHFNLAATLARLNRYPEAIASYDMAVSIRRDVPEMFNERGISLIKLKRHNEAVASFDRAVSIRPDYADAYNNRGTALRAIGRHEDAIASYDRALSIRPAFPEALNNRCNALQALNRYAEAIASYDQAIALRPDYAEAFNNRGHALRALNRHEEAAESYAKALAITPGYRYAFGSVMECKAYVCDWRDREAEEQRLLDRVRAGKMVCVPFPFLALSVDAAAQVICARTFTEDKFPEAAQALWQGKQYRHDRIRIAYLSADFREHAVSYLLAGVFELHDRSRFEIMAISMGPDDGSPMRSRLVKSFDRFVDVRGMRDEEVARMLREGEIDIAVDLMGFTQGCRPGILALRPAPVQVSYLGYPGTMGAPYIDYILADEFIIPRDQQGHYSEKVVYLPDCYQPNDSTRKIGEFTPSRAEAGLPEQGFVFCCFNNSYKINPQIFDVWMRLLREVPRSVLWLMRGNETMVANLRHEAQARQVEPHRLIFAPRVNPEQHLARHHLADLFLDTLPYNAHTTASDALWAGLPIVTCAGTTFAGRVAGSLLRAVGLPGLITDTLERYHALALHLATNPGRLKVVRDNLVRNRPTSSLFDTAHFTRNLESGYRTMWQTVQGGEPPNSFSAKLGG